MELTKLQLGLVALGLIGVAWAASNAYTRKKLSAASDQLIADNPNLF